MERGTGRDEPGQEGQTVPFTPVADRGRRGYSERSVGTIQADEGPAVSIIQPPANPGSGPLDPVVPRGRGDGPACTIAINPTEFKVGDRG